MLVNMQFQVEEYMGLWYLQYHKPQWFDVPGSTNTTAEYILRKDGKVTVVNTTRLPTGGEYQSVGEAQLTGSGLFLVSFPGSSQHESTPYNYNVCFLKVDNLTGHYIVSVVTNADLNALWVLTRAKDISVAEEFELLFLAKEIMPLCELERVKQF